MRDQLSAGGHMLCGFIMLGLSIWYYLILAENPHMFVQLGRYWISIFFFLAAFYNLYVTAVMLEEERHNNE